MATQKKVNKSTSALKRQRQAEKQHLKNKSVKSALKTLAKKVDQAVADKNADLAKESLTKAAQALQKAASQGVLHKNTASRKVSRLSKKVSAMSAA